MDPRSQKFSLVKAGQKNRNCRRAHCWTNLQPRQKIVSLEDSTTNDDKVVAPQDTFDGSEKIREKGQGPSLGVLALTSKRATFEKCYLCRGRQFGEFSQVGPVNLTNYQ